MGRAGTKVARINAAIDLESKVGGVNGFEFARQFAARASELQHDTEPEALYGEIVPIERRKRFGQYFTPVPIAELMIKWVKAIHPKKILDPAAGPGVFPRILKRVCPDATITAIDVDPVAISAARTSLGGNHQVHLIEHDFLTWADNTEFDAAIANPPYLRHHDIAYPFDIFALVGKKNSIKLSRLTNIYVLFILEICRRLRRGGRAAIIVPGEWVNANFGGPLKYWLLNQGLLHTILYFSHASTQFEDALTTASVLFIEKPVAGATPISVQSVFVHDGAPIEKIEAALHGKLSRDENVVVQVLSAETLLKEKKWNDILAHGIRKAMSGFVPLSTLASTHRGIATGANYFFHLKPSVASEIKIRSMSLKPCVGRATDVVGLVFTKNDYAQLVAADSRCLLLDIHGSPSHEEEKYLAKGQSEGLHKRYLCASRKEAWYAMEQRPAAPIWAAVFGRKGLRFIWNEANVANLTTFHCIYPHNGDDRNFAAALTACLNSHVVQELARQHHRVYGGGLLKMEPKDLLDIDVPDLRKVSARTLEMLKSCLSELNKAMQLGVNIDLLRNRLDELVRNAAIEATMSLAIRRSSAHHD